MLQKNKNNKMMVSFFQKILIVFLIILTTLIVNKVSPNNILSFNTLRTHSNIHSSLFNFNNIKSGEVLEVFSFKDNNNYFNNIEVDQIIFDNNEVKITNYSNKYVISICDCMIVEKFENGLVLLDEYNNNIYYSNIDTDNVSLYTTTSKGEYFTTTKFINDSYFYKIKIINSIGEQVILDKN